MDTSTHHVGPRFITTAPPEAQTGVPYTYAADALDPHIVGFNWHLTDAPEGMTVDPDRGAVAWTPAAAGNYTATLVVITAHGRRATQTWTIHVRKAAPERVRAGRINIRYIRALIRKAVAENNPELDPEPVLARTPRRQYKALTLVHGCLMVIAAALLLLKKPQRHLWPLRL